MRIGNMVARGVTLVAIRAGHNLGAHRTVDTRWIEVNIVRKNKAGFVA